MRQGSFKNQDTSNANAILPDGSFRESPKWLLSAGGKKPAGISADITGIPFDDREDPPGVVVPGSSEK